MLSTLRLVARTRACVVFPSKLLLSTHYRVSSSASNPSLAGEIRFDPLKQRTYRAPVPTVLPASPETNAFEGQVRFSPVKVRAYLTVLITHPLTLKASWFTFLLAGSAYGVYATFDSSLLLGDIAFLIGTTATVLLFGHSLGMHRLFIHRSFECSKYVTLLKFQSSFLTFRPLEYFLVHVGTLAGINGPKGMMKAHDIRDWAQRQEPGECHSFFSQQTNFFLDSHRQNCSNIHLVHPPRYEFPPEVANDRVYEMMQRTWMLQGLPWAIVFYALGGWHWVVYGVFLRTLCSMFGHFAVGWFAHNEGPWSNNNYHGVGPAVQGQNVAGPLNRVLEVISAGESHHNNHHAAPGSANLAHFPFERDWGYEVLKLMERVGLVWNVRDVEQAMQANHVRIRPGEE